MKKLLNTVVIGGISIVIAAAVFLPMSRSAENPIQEIFGSTAVRLPVDEVTVPVLRPNARSFEIDAAAALVVDLDSGKILYELESSKFWPPASLNKLMTALVVANTLSLSQVVEIEERDIKVDQPRMGLFAGESITIRDLLKGLLISSANDAGATLARVVTGSEERFVELMNLMAEMLGMDHTQYHNTTGFDSENQLTTAYDLSLLTSEFLKNDELAALVSQEKEVVTSVDAGVRHWLTNTNKLLERPNIFGVKTGFTDLAKGNLILFAKEGEHSVITIVLGSDQREKDSLDLVEWVFEVYEF